MLLFPFLQDSEWIKAFFLQTFNKEVKASTRGMKFTRTEKSAVVWTTGELMWPQACSRVCIPTGRSGRSGGLKRLTSVATAEMRHWKYPKWSRPGCKSARLVNLSLWIMSIHPSGTVALYNQSVHYHTSLPSGRSQLLYNRAKNVLRVMSTWAYTLHIWRSSAAF